MDIAEELCKCTLCGCWDYPVNHHNDCSLCAQLQYGNDE
jgi:hypothetical protein